MAAARGSARSWPRIGVGVPTARHALPHDLLGVPPMNQRTNLGVPLADLQRRLDGAGGKVYWRTLEELADSGEFQDLMRQEFPEQADVWPDAFSRRQFLTLMGASLALAGIGCSVRPAPTRTAVPRVRSPEERVPGRARYYATAMT